jgi:pimeloyl-ACP methyl ester carboxylesterase
MNSKHTSVKHDADLPLVVLLHGLHSSVKRLAGISQETKRQLPKCKILPIELPLTLWSLKTPLGAVVNIMDQIDKEWTTAEDESRPFSRIIIIGHSMGALLARKVYACAWGQLTGAYLEDELRMRDATDHTRNEGLRPGERPWARKVERLVLLSGVSRGWAVSSAMGHWERTKWAVYSGFWHLVPKWKPTIFAFRRGTPFLIEFRLQWLAMRREVKSASALIVQLLGTIDDLVPPQDYIDVVPAGPAQSVDLLYLHVPKTGHADIIDIEDAAYSSVRQSCSEEQHKIAEERRRIFVLALLGKRDEIANCAIQASDFDDSEPTTPNHAVTDVLFVIHGIRDRGFWTRKIAQHVKASARNAKQPKVVRSVTATYGYFGT